MNGADLNVTDAWTLWVIVGLAIITAVTRSFFFLGNSEWHLPHWAQRGLQYAPIAALSAVVVPEIVMSQGQLIGTWQDARIFAADRAWQSTRPRPPPQQRCGRLAKWR